ncbi:MAG: hypothetical protein ABIJ16_02275 [Bacteroidota bacterium]
MVEKNKYVFVVCGPEEHIRVLNYSVRCLKKVSRNEIIVITERKRNQAEIEHDRILDIETPAGFNDHQASIYLKTGIYKWLDMKHNYCYLDSDVIALHDDADKIFGYFKEPVTFAADHCRLDVFSPYAANCGCSENAEAKKKKFYALQKSVNPDYDPELMFLTREGRELFSRLYDIGQRPFANVFRIISYLGQKILPVKKIRMFGRYCFDKSKKAWTVPDGSIVFFDILGAQKEIEKQGEFRFHRLKKYWYDNTGNNIFDLRCNHLIEAIEKKYGLKITPQNWQHWNGGVFLFNIISVGFLESWHRKTIENFSDPDWKTRDQGTLAATVWESGLQNHPVLPSEYNFIADFYKPAISYRKNTGFTRDNFRSTFNPRFIHVYHHFGDKNWEVWKAVEEITGEEY